MSVSNTYTYTVLNRPPLWNTAATLSTINGADPYTTITVNAYDPDGGSVTYSLTSGSVPSGLTFVSANATIIGSANEVTDNTTSTFTVTATDPGSDANTRTFSLTVTPATDNEFANTVLLLKTAGNTVVSDASANNLPLSVVADARASNFNPFGNSWSNYFDGTDDNLYVSSKSSVDWMISSGNSGTIEAWIYVTAYRSAGSAYHHPSILGMGETYLNFGVRSGGTLRLYWYQGAEAFLDSSTTVPLNTWTHVAAVVNGSGSNNLKLYINGVNSGTGTFSNIFWSSGSGGNDLRIGSEGGNATSKWLGYISNLRVSNNAVYTANFSPSTTPLTTTASTTLLTCHKNRFVDETGTYTFTRNGDTKVSKFGPFSETDTSNGSMYFDGTDDRLSVASVSSLQLSTSVNWCMEAWIYPTSLANVDHGIIGKRVSGAVEWQFAVKGTGEVAARQIYIFNGTTSYTSGTAISGVNAWTHVAVTWDGTTLRFFINGTLCSSTYTSFSLPSASTNAVGIGANGDTERFTGYISNIRLVKGSAVYTSSFTPPTAPLTAIANTSLLTLQNRQPHNNHGFQDSSNNRHLVTRAGNASQGTFSPFSQTGWSTYFDGSSDGIVIPSSTFSGNWVNSNFTFEAWVYVTGNGPNGFIWLYGQNNNDCLYLGLSVTDKNINYGSFNGLSFNYSFSTSNNLWEMNKWFHVAWVRNSTGGNTNAMKVFLNGVLVGTGNSGTFGVFDNSFFFNSAYNPWADLDGYCAGLRLSNTALYSTNFTPGRLTNDPTTKVLLCAGKSLQDDSSNKYPLSVTGTPSVKAFSPFVPNTAYSTANTGGSMYLDGTGDWLSLSPDVFRFASTSKFTIEGWFYSPASTTGNFFSLYGCSNGGGGSLKIAAYDSGDGAITFDITGSSKVKTTTSVRTLMNGGWTHIALVREGTGTNETKAYINGVQNGVGTVSDDFYPLSNPFIVGHNGEFYANAYKGYISNFRIVIGHAIYTSAFTPSNVPLTVTPNTSLLLASTDAAIIDYTGKNTIETVGDAKANNSTYKFTPGSMYFDGTGDYLVAPANKYYEFGTGDFTIECWVRLITIDTAKMFVTSNYNAGTGAGGWALIHRADTSSLSLSVNSNVTYTKSWAPTAGIWYHVSVSRSGTNLRFFIDGTQIGTTSTSSDNITGSSTVIVAGNSTSNLPIDANINDLRITRSARYTTNFTAPTRSFPTR
jgi:hypothetical protein